MEIAQQPQVLFACMLLVSASNTFSVQAGAALPRPGTLIQVTRDIGDEHCWNSSRLAFNCDARSADEDHGRGAVLANIEDYTATPCIPGRTMKMTPKRKSP